MKPRYQTAAGIAAALILFNGAALAQQPGPGAWSDEQTWAEDTVNGGHLTGYYYWPASPPALDAKRALVLVLHGCVQTALGDVLESPQDAGFNWKAMGDKYGAVILAPNATGDLYAHCWDYSTPYHNRTDGHDGVLLDLVRRFIDDPKYAVDPNQVYVTGLSSGGGEAMALGCMAPDIFAGVGINAGPPPGTTVFQLRYPPWGYTASHAARKCRDLAGASAGKFTTQVASVTWGSADNVVTPRYGPLDAAAFRLVYGGKYERHVPEQVTGGGSNIIHSDGNGNLRTSELSVAALKHAWPAGPGGQNDNYVDATKVNYPAFVMDFWFKNNLRADREVTKRPAVAAGR